MHVPHYRGSTVTSDVCSLHVVCLQVDLVLSTEEALVPCRSRFVPSHLQSTLRPNKPRKVASVVSEQDLSSKTIGDALNYEAVSLKHSPI